MTDGEVGAGDVLGGGVLIDSRPGDFSLSKNNFKKNIYRIFLIIINVLTIKKLTILEASSPSFQEHV